MRIEDRRLPGEGFPQSLYMATYYIERRIRDHFRGTGLHWGLRRILQRLWISDGLSQKELSDSVGSSETSISNMIKNLIQEGWVEKRQDAYDYRVSRIHLTDKAIALGAAIAGELQQIDSLLRQRLGEADSHTLGKLLEVSLETLESSLPPMKTSKDQSLERAPSPPGEL